MSFTTQNQNVFVPPAMLGAIDLIAATNVVSVQILPSSSATAIQQGTAVKLIAGTSGAILVDVQTGPTDAAIFGVIPYNDRKNLYKAGDIVSVVVGGGYMYMRSSAAVARGTGVSITAATTTTDPLVTTDSTSGHFLVGTAIDDCTAANTLIRVQISPSKLA